MKIIKVKKYRINQRALTEAIAVLRAGGVVVHPSESSYGLAVDSTNQQAVKRLFELKGRSAGKSVLIVAGSKQQAARYVSLTPKLKRLADHHWPGPLTIVGLPKRTVFVNGGEVAADVAIRVPACLWPRALAAAFGKPITSTSVNLAGGSPAFSLSAVQKVFRGHDQPDLMLDVGTLPQRPPSTLIAERNGQIEILRQGIIKL